MKEVPFSIWHGARARRGVSLTGLVLATLSAGWGSGSPIGGDALAGVIRKPEQAVQTTSNDPPTLSIRLVQVNTGSTNRMIVRLTISHSTAQAVVIERAVDLTNWVALVTDPAGSAGTVLDVSPSLEGDSIFIYRARETSASASLRGKTVYLGSSKGGIEMLVFATDADAVTSDVLPGLIGSSLYTGGNPANLVITFPNWDRYDLNLTFTDNSHGTWGGTEHYEDKDHIVPTGSSFTIENP